MKTYRLIIFVSAIVLMLSLMTESKQLFRDDFESDTVGKEPSKWKVVDRDPGSPPGEILEEPKNPKNKVLGPSKRGDRMGRVYVVGEPDWKDYIAEWDWMVVIDNCIGMVFRYQDRDNHYLLDRRAGWANANEIHFYKRQAGTWTNFGQKAQMPTKLNVWYRTQLVVRGDTFSAKIKERDNKIPFEKIDVLVSANDSTFKTGYFGVYAGEDPMSAYFDNVVIGETEADLFFAVKTTQKLARTWGLLKASL